MILDVQEEQESARLQVQSLLPRAEEMVITLQVIMEIKAEVTHMQKELKNTKAIHKDVSCKIRKSTYTITRALTDIGSHCHSNNNYTPYYEDTKLGAYSTHSFIEGQLTGKQPEGSFQNTIRFAFEA